LSENELQAVIDEAENKHENCDDMTVWLNKKK